MIAAARHVRAPRMGLVVSRTSVNDVLCASDSFSTQKNFGCCLGPRWSTFLSVYVSGHLFMYLSLSYCGYGSPSSPASCVEIWF